MMNDEIEAILAERNTAFENDDLDWARSQLPVGTPDRVVTLAFHKARHACRAVSETKRQESQSFLRNGKHRDIRGREIAKDAPLP